MAQENITSVLDKDQAINITLADVLYLIQGFGGNRDRWCTLEQIKDFLKTSFNELHLEADGATTDIKPASLEMCDDEESDYRTEFLLDLLGNSEKGYGANLELSKDYGENSSRKFRVKLGRQYSDVSEVQIEGVVNSVDDIDGNTHVSGFHIGEDLLMLSKVYTGQGGTVWKKIRFKWDTNKYVADIDCNMNFNDLVYIDGSKFYLSKTYNPGSGNVTKICQVQWDVSNHKFIVTCDGDVTVNGNVNVNGILSGLEDVSQMLSIDGTNEGKSEWMKAKYWQLGQTRKVKNVSGSSVVVPVYSEAGVSQDITFRNNRYREFICVGFASQNPGADTPTYLLPGDNY